MSLTTAELITEVENLYREDTAAAFAQRHWDVADEYRAIRMACVRRFHQVPDKEMIRESATEEAEGSNTFIFWGDEPLLKWARSKEGPTKVFRCDFNMGEAHPDYQPPEPQENFVISDIL